MAAPGLALIHSPLLNASSWHDVAMRLEADGYSVAAPDFAPALSQEPFYLGIAQSVARGIACLSGDVVLIGHSGAGALFPACAAALGTRVRGALFVDAILPHPGRAWFDTVPAEWKTRLQSVATDGYLPPWHEWWPQHIVEKMLPHATERKRFTASLQRRPLAYFEAAAPDIELPPSVRCAYFQLSPGYETEAQHADLLGWPVRQKMLGHLAMVTDPDAVALGVQDLIAKLGL